MTTKRILFIALINSLIAGIFTIFIGFMMGLYEYFTGDYLVKNDDDIIYTISFLIGSLIGLWVIFSFHFLKK